jgi:hypothetical protein
MDWLTQNWLWIILLVGMVIVMRRGGLGGCGMGHAHHTRERDEPSPGRDPRNALDSPDSGQASLAKHRHHGCC